MEPATPTDHRLAVLLSGADTDDDVHEDDGSSLASDHQDLAREQAVPPLDPMQEIRTPVGSIH